MRKIAIIVGRIICVLWLIWTLYDSVTFFSKNIIDLLYVFAIALVGGASYVVYDKLSLHGRRRLLLWLWGIISIVLSGFCFWFFYTCVLIFHSGPATMPLEIVAIFVVFAFVILAGVTYSWWQFYGMLKKQ